MYKQISLRSTSLLDGPKEGHRNLESCNDQSAEARQLVKHILVSFHSVPGLPWKRNSVIMF
jgi:hypothetical protein